MYATLTPEWAKYKRARILHGLAHGAAAAALADYKTHVSSPLPDGAEDHTYRRRKAWVDTDSEKDKADTKLRQAAADWVRAAYRVCGANTSIEWDEDGNCIVQGVMLFML